MLYFNNLVTVFQNKYEGFGFFEDSVSAMPLLCVVILCAIWKSTRETKARRRERVLPCYKGKSYLQGIVVF